MSVTPEDCRACGLCCTSFRDQDALADLSEEDLERLDPRWIKSNVLFSSPYDLMLAAIDGTRMPVAAIQTRWGPQKRGPLKGYELCACVALRGSVLHRTSCSIYERRPGSCRTAVEPGDITCVAIRRWWLAQLEDLQTEGAVG